MKHKAEIEMPTETQIAGLADKLCQMHKRTLAAAAPLKARYVELREEMKMLQREIQFLGRGMGASSLKPWTKLPLGGLLVLIGLLVITFSVLIVFPGLTDLLGDEGMFGKGNLVRN